MHATKKFFLTKVSQLSVNLLEDEIENFFALADSSTILNESILTAQYVELYVSHTDYPY